MNNKTTLSLLEMLLMVLIFSLASALCLRTFVYADRVSKEDALTAQAEREARSAAEILKGVKGDVEAAAKLSGGRAEGNTRWIVEFESLFTVTAQAQADGWLGTAQVEVRDMDGNLLYELVSSWQEGTP